jgi:hypothetical protein
MTSSLSNLSSPKPLLVISFLALVAVLTGCREGPHIAPLTGKVLLDGQPLEFGSVMLQPVEGGEPARAQIQSDGTFVMTMYGVGEGAAVGLNRVRVTCFAGQRPGGSTVAADGELAVGGSLIPTRYSSFGSSGLTIEVLPGENEPYVIELSSR